jgi:5-methylcytosine-specific restriction endonuclease McrA
MQAPPSNPKQPPSGDSEPSEYFILDPVFTDPRRLKKERERARELKKSSWWNAQVQKGICHYCGGKFTSAELTMDHVVPLARGGESTRGNIVPACRACNQSKKLETPVDQLLKKIRDESGERD